MQSLTLEKWVERQIAEGKYGFPLALIKKSFPLLSGTAIKFALIRLTEKKKILSIHKGYYLIIPPQYASKGVLPPSIYMDGLMSYLKRPYYLALLNAAAFHGSTHQQAQEFYIITTFPVLRPTQKNGLKVNFFSKNEIPESLLETRKSESGYFKISNPALTVLDLVQFEKTIGGLNRVATLLSEMTDSLNPGLFTSEFIRYAPVSALQRLGYLLDMVSENRVPGNRLYEEMKKETITLFRVPLKASGLKNGFHSDNRWKIIVNATVESEE